MEEELTTRRQLRPHDAQLLYLFAIFEINSAVLQVLWLLDLDAEAFDSSGQASLSREVLAEDAKFLSRGSPYILSRN